MAHPTGHDTHPDAAASELPLAVGAARVLLPRLDEMLAEEAKALGGKSEEGVHDMRVATKRLREGLRLFRPAFKRKAYRKHLEWVEAVNDALGEVRDLDVLTKRLRKRAARSGPAPAGLESLLERLGRRREGARSWLAFHLDRVRNRGLAAKFASRLGRSAEAAVERDAGASNGDAAGSQTIGPFAIDEILERLARVRRRWDAVMLDARPETFHRVRIANKRLRYAIEPFIEWLPTETRVIARLSAKFHDALGDMHDEDVLLVRVETELCASPIADRPAWERLARDTERRRRRQLTKTLRLADLLSAPAGWDQFQAALAIEREARSAPPASPATPAATVDGNETADRAESGTDAKSET